MVIVGTGAGGGTLAHALAGSGSGSCCWSGGISCPGRRELESAVGVRGRKVHVQGHLVRRGGQAVPAAGALLRRRGHQAVRRGPVPAAARRFRGTAHVDGISPAWPLSYDDFEPWYSKAEQSTRCTPTVVRTRPRSTAGPYPWPAVSHEPRIAEISEGLEKGGYHPFHAPCGIMLDEPNRPASACIRCSWCDGYPCLVHAKSDAEVIAVVRSWPAATSPWSPGPR